MLSNCPQCKKQIEHEDFLFEVICDCGTRFNPFMGITDIPGLDGVTPPAAPEWKEPVVATVDYSESQAVFNELKNYAEDGATPTSTAPVQAPVAPTSTATAPRSAPSTSSDAIMTSGDGLPGYRIEAYLAPLSASAPLDVQQSNPLRAGFDALWAQAENSGANGIVAVRWVLSPDGSRVVLSGTPVQCSKEHV